MKSSIEGWHFGQDPFFKVLWYRKLLYYINTSKEKLK